MPYIAPGRRALINEDGRPPADVGDLTYVLFVQAVDYLRARDESYAVHAEVVAALSNALDEYRRRYQHRYEDRKIRENGDI
jgi:hypothetical protein